MSPPAPPADVRAELAQVRGALSKASELSESCDGMLELLAGLANPASDASARAQLGHKVLQAAEMARGTLKGLKAVAPRLEAARLRAVDPSGTAPDAEAQHAAAALAHAQAAEAAFASEWRLCSGGPRRASADFKAGDEGGGAADVAVAGALRAAAVALQGRGAALALQPPTAAHVAAAASGSASKPPPLPVSDAALCDALRSTRGLWVVHPGRCVLVVALAPGVWPPHMVRIGAFGCSEQGRWCSPWAHSPHRVFAGVAERATQAAAALQANQAGKTVPGARLAKLLCLLGDHTALFTATKGGKVLAGHNAQPQLPHGAQRELTQEP